MAITTVERSQIIELVTLMFNAAPGATYLSQIVAIYEANPGAPAQKLGQLAHQLTLTPAFQSLHPNFETVEEFAADFLTPLGLQSDAFATDFVVSRLNGGMSKGQLYMEALNALNNLPAGSASQYVAAADILDNKTTVAVYYSVTANGAATDISTLQNVIASVTAVDSTVTSAIAAIEGTAGGASFTLTINQDNIVGTSGNDAIFALVDNTADTLTLGDVINGGAGTDTLTITTDQPTISVAAATISNVEHLVYNSTATGAVAATTADVNNVAFASATFKGVAGVDGGDDTLVISNVKKATTVVLQGIKNVGTTVNFSDVTGTADAATVEVAGSTDTATASDAENDLTVAGVETLTLNLTTAANDLDTITAAAAKTVNINVSGGNARIEAAANFSAATALNIDAAKNLTLTATADLAADAVVTVVGAGNVNLNTLDDAGVAGDGVTVSAAALTGDLTVTGGANTKSITSGAGDDSITSGALTTTITAGAGDDYVSIAGFDYGSGAATNGTVAGGDGTDTLNITVAANLDAGTMARATGFEILSIGGSAGGNYGIDGRGFTGVVVDADIAATTVSGITTQSVSITESTTAALTLALKTATGTTDALTVTIEGDAVDTGSDGDTSNDTNDLTAAELVTASIETLTLVSNTAATNEAGVSNVVSVLATDATKLVVTGNHTLTISDFQEDTSAGVNTDTVTIDASGSAGLVMGDFVSALGVSLLGSASADTLLVGDVTGDGSGAATGSTINAAKGGDVVSIATAGAVDTLIVNVGDSKIGYTDTDESGTFTSAADEEAYDIVSGFTSGEDTIDLGSFSFTGTKASALAGPSLTEANAVKLVNGTTTSIAGFFVDTGVQRGVAVVSGDYGDLGGSGAADTLIFIDSNADGNLTVADDMILLSGVATVTLADFGF